MPYAGRVTPPTTEKPKGDFHSKKRSREIEKNKYTEKMHRNTWSIQEGRGGILEAKGRSVARRLKVPQIWGKVVAQHTIKPRISGIIREDG